MTANRFANAFARICPPVMGGVDTRQEAAFRASHYRHARHVRRLSPAKALEVAKELPAAYVKGREYYASAGNVGAAGPDGVRHVADTRAAGLRFCAFTDSLPGRPRHGGVWYSDEDGHTGNRGAVWQVTGKDGKARLVAGYIEVESRGREWEEMNEGSALIDFRHIITGPCPDSDAIDDLVCDAAGPADSMAEHAAEKEREYRAAYDRGYKAGERDNAIGEARRELLAILPDIRAARGNVGSTLFDIAKGRVDELLETISTLREKRETAWGDCPTCDEPAWTNGFMDAAEGGFRRAVALGYRKAADWEGKPEENPCKA